MLSKLLRPMNPQWYTAPPPATRPKLSIRSLGTAGFAISSEQHHWVLDPFVSRQSLLSTALGRLRPDEEAIRRWIPHADEVLVGHAHFDHVLDAPTLCHQTGARLVGSPAVGHVGRAAGLPEGQICVTEGLEDIPSGPGLLRGLPSQHGRVYFNRVSLPGDITQPPSWPPRLTELRHGLVLNWYLEVGGLRVVHVDSADYHNHHLEGLEADVLCLCAIGRRYRPGYVEDALRLLRPRYVIACHWEWFMDPPDGPQRMLPGVNLPGFLSEIRRAGAEPVLLPFNQSLVL